MEDHGDDSNSPNHSSEQAEPVRSRWTPKPEQIMILESIFNSGMVNPPKDETVRIRMLLEKFGSVGDANVFYWFQNRRSRSRRRQRQLLAATSHQGGSAIHYDGGCGGGSAGVMNFAASSSYLGGGGSSSSASGVRGDSGSDGSGGGFSMSGHMGFSEMDQPMVVSPSFCPLETSNLDQFQSGNIIIFINGVPTEVPQGAVDMKAMFGEETVLVHSSGLPVLTNEFGISLYSLQNGESYFLVSRQT